MSRENQETRYDHPAFLLIFDCNPRLYGWILDTTSRLFFHPWNNIISRKRRRRRKSVWKNRMINIYIRVIPRLCYGNRPHPISSYVHPPIFLRRCRKLPVNTFDRSAIYDENICRPNFFSVDYY